jgi:hypothetical protein
MGWSVDTETGWSVGSETPGQLTLKQGGQFRVKRGGQLGVKYSPICINNFLWEKEHARLRLPNKVIVLL